MTQSKVREISREKCGSVQFSKGLPEERCPPKETMVAVLNHTPSTYLGIAYWEQRHRPQDAPESGIF